MEYIRRAFLILGVVLLLLVYAPQIFAATITMQTASSHIAATDEYVVDAALTIAVADGTNYYLRGVFYKTGTSGNYCGYTWNGSDWFKGPFSQAGEQKQFFKITIKDHQWSGEVKAKIDANDTACSASGNYSFKLQRFTDTSNAGTFDDQTEQTVTVDIPTPTPTDVPTPTPSPTPKPAQITPTAKTPMVSSGSRPANTTTNATVAVLRNPIPTMSLAASNNESSFGAVLGTGSSISPTGENKPTPMQSRPAIVAAAADHRRTISNWFSFLFMLVGFGLLASCGILFALRTEKGKDIWKRFF